MRGKKDPILIYKVTQKHNITYNLTLLYPSYLRQNLSLKPVIRFLIVIHSTLFNFVVFVKNGTLMWSLKFKFKSIGYTCCSSFVVQLVLHPPSKQGLISAGLTTSVDPLHTCQPVAHTPYNCNRITFGSFPLLFLAVAYRDRLVVQFTYRMNFTKKACFVSSLSFFIRL